MIVDTIDFEGIKIEVEEIQRGDWDYILYKSIHSNDYFLFILLNHSFAYYSKLAKVSDKDMAEFLDQKIPIKELVNRYR